MRIAFLSRYQNLINRGAETYVLELSKRLDKKFSVDILAGGDSDSLNLVLRGKYDWVISVNGGMQAFKASLGRFFSRYKLLISGQAGIGRVNIWNTLVVQPDIFVALTDYMAKWVKKWAWNSKLIKIPNGVDLTKFTPFGERVNFDLERPWILSVGALVWYKHHDRTIEAVSRLQKGSLIIVGSGEEKEKLKRLGEEKLKGRFKIVTADYDQLPKIYRSVDIFTLPSWKREAFGIVYLEAMASGLGIVAPNDLARSEIIADGGILTDVSDSEKYAQAIDQALNLDWKDKAINQAKKFSWDRVAKEYEEVFKRSLHD